MGSPSEVTDILAAAEAEQAKRPVLNAVHLFIALGLFVGTLATLFVLGKLDTIGSAMAAAFFILGKLIILKGAIVDNPFGMTTFEFAIMVFCMDCWVAYLLTFNLHRIYRIPRIGPSIQRLQNYCRYWIVRQPWMRRWAFTGVMLFVMFPLTGTGAPGGAILGRLVGLSAATALLGVFIGAALGCTVMAVFAEQLEPVLTPLQDEPWFQAVGIGIILVLLFLLFRLGRRISRAADEYASKADAEGENA